jgi:hypothetical protein
VKRSFQKFVTRLDEVELRKMLEERALMMHVSLKDLYEGPDRAPSITAARRDAYLWLMGEGKGINEIARLFDRAPSGVLKLTQKNGTPAKKARGKAKAL